MKCELCGSDHIKKIKDGVSLSEITPHDFAVTDKKYGLTLEIYRCLTCDFQYCPTADDLIKFYELMDDEEYTGSDRERKKQY